jgi:hypothetical protein
MERRGVLIPPTSLALIPADVEIYELDAALRVRPKAEWTGPAAKNIAAVLDEMAFMAGVSTYDAAQIEGSRGKHGASYVEFRRWGNEALDEIAAQSLRLEDFGRKSVTEWRFEGDLRPWRAILKSSYVLVVRFRDAHEAVSVEPSQEVSYAKAHAHWAAVACVVDLSDGRVDWCRVLSLRLGDVRLGDLRSPDDATAAVHNLLRDVLPARGQK